MIRLYSSVICFFLFTYVATAQPYGNEWINFSTTQPYSNQQYFKVNVWRDGIYRITPADLQNAGFPSGINPKQFQLFYKGAEQYIHVEGEADGVFDPSDYIEFYGRKNDGTADTRLYKNPNFQVNTHFSLITDTATYFLTLNANAFITNRRMGNETDVNFIGYTPIPYFIREAFTDYTTYYAYSKVQDLIDAEYDEGEGYYDSPMGNAPVAYPLSTPNVSSYPTAPASVASSTVVGNNTTGSTHTLQLEVSGVQTTIGFSGYAVSKFILNLPNGTLSSGTTNFNFTPLSPQGITNRTAVSFVKMVYPHTLSFSGEGGNFRKMLVPGNLAPGKSFLDITGLLLANPKLYVFVDDTLKRVSITTAGTTMQALIPTFGSDRSCFITDSIYSVSSGHMNISPINNDPGHFARFTNFQFISNADYLIVTHASLLQKAEDYRFYRDNSGYTPLMVDVDELYNQFGYGISKHPQSIKNFCEFTLDTFLLKPKYLLLIGKSVNPKDSRFITASWNKNMVPSFGFPCADMLFSSCFDGDSIPNPAIATGRISAQNDDDIQAYLDKVIAHDLQLQQCPKDWMKQILHFGGGNNIYQQNEIKTILESYEEVAEDTLMAANVIPFYKTSSDPIQVNLSQYLQALIDSGTTMMTFVAHASGSTFDISTDIPQNYNNKDRYPLMVANSCFVGDIHQPTRKLLEDFILLPEKGAIAFIAEPDVGYLPNLAAYTKNLYKQIGSYNYGGTLGMSMRNSIDSIYADPNTFSNPYFYLFFKSVCIGMTLSGDPALVINSFDKPDYVIEESKVFFTPANVTSDIDSFDVSVIIKNLGRATNISSVLHMIRHFPDGTTYERDSVLGAILYQDTITFTLPVEQATGIGPNSFDFYADYFNTVDECENFANNNALGIPLLIQSTDIVPVYPAEFAIVPNDSIKLKASTVNPFSPVKPYTFQIDTTDRFNSPFVSGATINSAGGVVQWQLPFQLQPDLVYYWRVSRDSLPGDTIHPPWKQSSFIHKPGLTGWSQAHYSQFKKDEFINLNYKNDYDTTFSFVTSYSSLDVNNYYQPNPTLNPEYLINNVVQDYQYCFVAPSVYVAVIDSLTLKPWDTGQHHFGNHNTWTPPPNNTWTCRNRAEFYFIFPMMDAAKRDSMIDMLVNDVPNGNYIIAYTVFGGNFSAWTQPQKDVFTSLGSTSINTLTDSNSWIFFVKKGYPATVQEAIGDSVVTATTVNAQLGGNWSKGYVVSVPIGPAVNWNSLHWDQDPFETTPGADSTAIDIIGIQSNGLETPITGFTGIQVNTPDLNISAIDASVYPKLKLQAYVQDEVLFTPPQLKRWQIYYDEIPELAINPNRHFFLNKDTLAEGEQLIMQVAIENIGNVNADSLLADFYLFDDDRVRHNLSSPRYKPTAPGDTIIASINFNTGGYAGLNSLWLEANPRSDQPEQYHFNNFAEIDFKVNRDITNPILDVTFDGVHIMNGDIVSGKPDILIRLKDENKYIALKDTGKWQIFIRTPLGTQKKLRFEPNSCSGPGTSLLKWCPATLPKNSFLIQFKPVLAVDGIYELWVQAADESGNISGDNNYKIKFEVINKSTITEVVNYPNPFSTSTRFVFTLTGSEVPQGFKIQIMTVSGKVVREILQSELGPIHIGRNITEYAWDGKDEFGDQLANGVYLYRVTTSLNGYAVEKRESDFDEYFTKGWGKMYLLR